MVEQDPIWPIENEGNLARTWEQRLKPRTAPQIRRRRTMAPWVRIAAWIGGIWAAALIPAILAVHVLTMSYHYDQLNQQYLALIRQNEMLAATVAAQSSPAALARDSARLKVPLVAPRMETTPRHVHGATLPVSPLQHVTIWISGLNHALER